MPILIEAQSIVLSVNEILSRYRGGWEGFRSEIPNDSLCCDHRLVRVGFMNPDDGADYLAHLLHRGLRRGVPGRASDFATIDQLTGPIVAVDWLEMSHVCIDEDPQKTVLACRMVGDTSRILAVPDGWEFEGSLSQRCLTFETGREAEYFDYLGRDGRIDLYRNIATGETHWIERST